ncbi:MAG TPA: amidohydrolase family protein [Acidimicrobiales bacterium]|jgi:N-acyl-D-aspartate/D-glutamate deacylase|nr:amidohydrolase family protein [Acidimicrobiales bacterium]
MLDVLIRGGAVIDGSGAPRRTADVGIRDGRVVEIGRRAEPARETIEADGLVVAPGFVDVHTHFDAQVFWDPTLSPSPLHGITTALAGNCGFTIAPLDQRNAEYLMRMLARVEGMPLAALRAGVPWDWTSTAEYLDRIEGTLGVNAGFMVGHSALRRVVMNEEGTRRASTADELAAMVTLLRQGLAAGGLGFSSSWGPAHLDDEGEPVPSRHATADELIALAGQCRDFEGTSLEFIPTRPLDYDHEQAELMAAMSVAAQRPLNWNVMRVRAATMEHDLGLLEAGTLAAERGGKVVALSMPLPSAGRFSFHSGFVLDGFDGWEKVFALPVPERVRVLRDPETRRALDASAQASTTMREVADWGQRVIVDTFTDATRHYQGRVVADIAREEGKQPFDALLDIVCADDLRTTFTRVQPDDNAADWAANVAVWRDGRAIIGGSDAGAHLDFTANFHYAPFVLARAVRHHAVLPLEEAVRYFTSVPAALYGLRDRGALTLGAWADVVVFDADTVAPGPIRMRFDLPTGAGRLYGEPTGITNVLVNGREIVHDGEFTDARPGTLLRSGRDTYTAPLS